MTRLFAQLRTGDMVNVPDGAIPRWNAALATLLPDQKVRLVQSHSEWKLQILADGKPTLLASENAYWHLHQAILCASLGLQ